MSEEGEEEQLRRRLHEQVDRMFEESRGGLGFQWAALQLAGMLLKGATSVIDAGIGQHAAGATHTASEWLQLGEQARKDVQAAIHRVDGKTFEATACPGVLGAAVTLGLLAAASGDPYLQVVAEALQQLGVGQIHPWLVAPKARVHPPQHAHSVLSLKAVPFRAIEYLVASGAYPTKTLAQEAVLDRLGIAEETLKDWRKAQNRMRRADFAFELKAAAAEGKAVGTYRAKLAMDPRVKAYIDAQYYYRIAAVEQCAAALRAIGADKGRKS